MGASQFVGRVGGLAVALGVGVAVFSGGSGVASADRSGPDAGNSSGASSANDSSQRASRGPSSTGRAKRHSAPVAVESDTAAPAAAVAPASSRARLAAAAEDAPEVVVEDAGEVLIDPLPEIAIEPPTIEPPTLVKPEPEVVIDPVVDYVVDPVEFEVPMEAAPDGEVTAYLSDTADPSDGAGTDPSVPVDSPLLAAFLAYSTRRDVAAATDSPQASVTASAVQAGGLTVDPNVYYYDGILQGNLNAVSAAGNTLTYTFVESSNGGKITIGNVPAPLPGSGAQSYTLLPYATWIDPAAPNPNKQPTGTQTWSVRVSEVTKFDQFLINIPLVGMIAQPIIDLLQKTPLLSTLLAPIIGSSVVAEISADLNELVAAGKAVAYTYKVTSFDGVEISTNFFPASTNSLFPGNYQATVFNGPGLGSPGETNPYGSFQAAGSTPGLPIIRGALPSSPAGSGFNVITWDPRGEFDSGGVLQLDNPFYEGRDVSALIDWAEANTPLLPIDGKPAIGMLGGSYGGGIQMTTVDPRIKAVVPAIAWNSLNESLYPSEVFKTAWANTLALELLSTGARSNDQIQSGIISGNLTGYLSETAQAVLASSGPTSLLTKLSIPTMYVQGIVDALFPLDQAVTNAETQLEQNPYFTDRANEVKMIWFCGGHGVCFDPVDQTAQATEIFTENMLWLNKYVKGAPIPIDLLVPTFQWWDQAGARYKSALMPFADAFVSGEVTATDDGGRLRIKPFGIGGSGPNGEPTCQVASSCKWPFQNVFATEADNALNVEITVPNANTTIVGAPTLSFDYSGRGSGRAVYAQIVDETTGRVLGNIATAIPVTLDGKSYTTSVSLENIVYTSQAANAKLKLQIVSAATLYKRNAIGSVNISNIEVSLPTTTAGVKVV